MALALVLSLGCISLVLAYCARTNPFSNPNPDPDPDPNFRRSSIPDLPRREVRQDTCASMAGLTKTDAEQLLDRLEARGHHQRELCYSAEDGFEVRWVAGH